MHTWPELHAVTLDVYVCNFGGDHSIKAQALLDDLTALFAPSQIQQHRLLRGGAVTDQASLMPVGKAVR